MLWQHRVLTWKKLRSLPISHAELSPWSTAYSRLKMSDYILKRQLLCKSCDVVYNAISTP